MKFDYKYIPKKIVYDFFCGIPFRVKAFMRQLGYNDKNYTKIRMLKNKYEGQSCFLIGTGPSLLIDDLNLLKDFYTFSMNSIIMSFGKTAFRPTYYAIHDVGAFKRFETDIKRYGIENVLIGIDETGADDIKIDWCDDGWIPFPVNSYFNAVEFAYGYKAKFSDNAYVYVYNDYTVTMSLLQLIYYMGFTTVYLLGVDCNYVPGIINHFEDFGMEKMIKTDPSRQHYLGYLAAKQFSENKDFHIVNCTRGGKLDLFKRMPLENAIALIKSEQRKEN